jgi:hypothetical protein
MLETLSDAPGARAARTTKLPKRDVQMAVQRPLNSLPCSAIALERRNRKAVPPGPFARCIPLCRMRESPLCRPWPAERRRTKPRGPAKSESQRLLLHKS